MNAKFLVVGAIAGGIFIFLWGYLTHNVLPQPFHTFRAEEPMTNAVRANAGDGNGMYFTNTGVFCAVAILPDMGDKTKNIVPSLLIQLGTDTLAALLLCLLVGGIRVNSTFGRAMWLLAAGCAAFALKDLPYWNWYGFSVPFLGMEALDLLGKFFLGGLLLSFLQKKLVPQTA
jgi:hypothetical protein